MKQYQQQLWSEIDKTHSATDDCLLACLVLLTRFYRKPYSAQALKARLPTSERLTLELFPRAAERAGFESMKANLSYDALKKQTMPLILLLNDHKAVLLVRDEKNEEKILNPLQPDDLLPLESIKDNYTGEAIKSRPKFKSSDRAKEVVQEDKKNWFWRIFLKSWPLYAEVLMASLLINIFALVVPLFIMNVYDRVVPNHAVATMWVLASGVAIVFLFDVVLKTLRGYFIDIASKNTDMQLSANIFQQIMGLRMKERPKSVGALANTVQSFEVFRDFITSGTMTVLVDLPFTVIFLMVIALIAGPVFWIPFAVIPLILIIGLSLQWPLIKLTKKSFEYAGEKQATLFESLSTIEHVKTTGAESNLQSRWEQVIKLASDNNMKLRFVSNTSMNLTTLLQQLATIGVVIFGVYMISEGELTTGALIAATMLTGRAMAPMGQVASLFTRYFQSVNALKSLDKIMQLQTDIEEESHYLHRPKLAGSVTFKQVSFAYDEDDDPQLKGVSFDIKSGERVAIIGRIGSGKSTIAKLLLKLYEPKSGSILLDNTDYRQINPDDLRQQIGYVPQDFVLFYGSVRENICVGAPFVSDADILRAAEISGVTRFTNNNPKGFDRQVGEKGNQLSGGQRQSVALARALLLRPHLLILDEPTSAMDDSSERLVKNNLKKYLEPTDTLILVTHKISMLELVDRIIVMDNGRIIADGKKESVLLAIKAGMAQDKES